MSEIELNREGGKRKTRSDKGRVYLTPRDIITLRWIGEQYGIRLDQLTRLLGRSPGRDTKVSGQVSEATAWGVVRRWKKLGLVEVEKFYFREPYWIWLTAEGLRQLNLSYRIWRPKLGILQHTSYINEIRLFVENKYGEEVLWRSEREIRSSRGRGKHLVDAELILEEETIAIEVELTVKRRSAIISTMRHLSREYSEIWYFATNRTHPVIKRAISELPDILRDRFSPPLKLDELLT